MKKIIHKTKSLILSRTAKNTYTLFVGNTADAFFSFLFSVFAFRLLETSEFGIFSAINNFVIIVFSLLDLGIGSGVIKFVSYHEDKKEGSLANKYLKAGVFLRIALALTAAVIIWFISPVLAPKAFLTNKTMAILLAGVAVVFLSIIDITTFALQARSKFKLSAITYTSFSGSRILIFFLIGKLAGEFTLSLTILSTVLASILSASAGLIFLGRNYLKEKPDEDIYKRLISFSGWIGLSRIATSLGGRIDTQLVLLLLGAFSAGIYSVAARIASFYPVIVTSFSSVLAPRLASATTLEEVKPFIKKSILAVALLILAMGFGILIAHPFIILLFGEKAAPSVPVFQALTLAFIPFVANSLAISTIIYTLKKPWIIGLTSILQTILVIVGQLILIPTLGKIGPAVSMGIANTITMLISYSVIARSWKTNEKRTSQ